MYNSFHINHTFGIFKNNIYDLERLAKRVAGMIKTRYNTDVTLQLFF